MTASKETMRPISQHRLSVGSSGPNFASRTSTGTSRQHAHSVSLGSFNSASRVNRRKSSFSASSVNKAALAAAAREANGLSALHADGDLAGSPSPGVEGAKSSSVLIDGPPLSSLKSTASKGSARARRASDGQRLIKERRNTNSGELKSCDVCGKSYKHGSCLQKHLWEHTPEWALTSKLLLSKHAQVQLLEAASVLVTMTQDKEVSDTSSQSPLPSGSSPAIEDEDSSSRTSTPSDDQDDQYEDYATKPTTFRNPRRHDSYSSVFSRSYQSTAASSVPNDAFYSRQWITTSRPSTATNGQSYADEQADLAAAAESLVSCSIGTPQFRPTSMHLSDVPPVPPLPAKFAAQASPYLGAQSESSGDVDMSDDEPRYRQRSDEDEDGVFGKME